MKEVIVLIGNYGSGKTELALNFAFRAAREGKKVELIDLDMVNTYFRLTDRGNLIKSREIRLVSPNYVHTSVETLSLPAEVASAFALDWDTVIFDVGGDPPAPPPLADTTRTSPPCRKAVCRSSTSSIRAGRWPARLRSSST